MKKSIKVMSFIMAAAMVMVGFSACGNDQGSSSKAADESKASSTASAAADESKASSGEKIKISVITMDSIDEHWLKLQAGAKDAADKAGNVEIRFDAPPNKIDSTQQASLVENAINDKVDGIMLAALDKTALSNVVDKAHDAGIKVVLVDSGVETDKWDAFYSTDNAKAAQQAADKMAELVGEKGTIGIVNAQAGAGTTQIREQSFIKQIQDKYPDMKCLDPMYSEGDKQKALGFANDLMNGNSDLVGIYGCNEGATVGVGQAVEQAGKQDAISVVGFDFSKDVEAMIESGAIKATMVQNPKVMGQKGVEAIVALMNGETISEKEVDTGVTVATKDNLDKVVADQSY
nr:ABC transporter substrate-binding protein [uncultured Solibaculum sp.]